MGGSEKWSVIYTKHIKQKRKVYQDGFLELDALSHKVILYDDSENILHSRFVKKDDIIKSGETLAFDCYLVDIGDLSGNQKPLPKFNTKVTMTSKSFQSPKLDSDTASVNRKPKLGKDKTCMRNLGPSQKIIREFKKSEMNKYGFSAGSFDTKRSSKTEWQALYTTQITQKAKKYHDGVLQLLICGSQKQILLYDANRRLLDSRFLKKDEVIRSGESITFDSHQVDVGECEGDNKPLMDLNLEGKVCHVHAETKAGPQEEASPRKHFNSNTHCSIDQHNLSGLGISKKPVRATEEILSVLKKPMTQKDVGEVERQSLEWSHASESSHVYNFDSGNQLEQQPLREICPEGRKVVDINEESTTRKRRSETPKTEAVKVLSDEINDIDKEEFQTSGFSTGSGCISKEMVDIGCTNTGETHPDQFLQCCKTAQLIFWRKDTALNQSLAKASFVQLWYISSTSLLHGQSNYFRLCRGSSWSHTAAPGIPVLPFEEVEPKNTTQQYADSKQIDAVFSMEKLNNWTSHDFSDDKLKIPEQDISKKENDELPSFDLGF